MENEIRGIGICGYIRGRNGKGVWWSKTDGEKGRKYAHTCRLATLHMEDHAWKLDEDVSRGMNADLQVTVEEHKRAFIALKQDTKGRHVHIDRDMILQLFIMN